MANHVANERRPPWALVAVFVGLTLGIVAIGYLYYRHYERSFRIGVEQQLSAIADLKVGELVQWRKERLGDGAVLFNNAAFTGLVRRFLGQPEDADARRQLQAWIGKIQANSQHDRVFLLDTQGVERISAPGTPEPVAPHLVQDVPAVLRSGQVTMLDFHRDAPDRPIRLSDEGSA